jgi:hypothetical protein
MIPSMDASPRSLVLLALLLPFAASAPARSDGPQEKPFPVARTVVLKDAGTVYVVKGRQVIPEGVEITGQKGIRLRGEEAAVLVVEGALVIHGIAGTVVTIAGVRIEPAESVQQLHLDHCDFQAGSTVATPPGKTTSGMITVENCRFAAGGGVHLDVVKGEVNVMNVAGSPGVRLKGVDPENGPNRIRAKVYGCKIHDGLSIENVYDVVVRTSLLRGSPQRIAGCPSLLFDGNRVESGPLVIEQPIAGAFRGTTITKCDLVMDVFRIFAPLEEGKTDAVALDKCWFSAGNDADAIAKVIEDQADDPKNGVKVRLKNPADKPHGFVKASE